MGQLEVRSQRILITGASGLLGLNLALELAPEHTVFGQVNSHRLDFDSFRQGGGEAGSASWNLIQADLCDQSALARMLDTSRPDWIIHCAALANLDACEANPAQAGEINAQVPAHLAKWVARQRRQMQPSSGGHLPRLLHISTDAVFDGIRGRYTENDQPNPLGVYARTKLLGEQLVLDADPEAIVARVNLFGWSLQGKRSLGELFVFSLQAGKSMMGFTDVIFSPLLVNDLASIFLRMLTLRLSGLYHVVSSEAMSKYDFGVQVARKFNLDPGLIKPTRVADSGLKAPRAPNLDLDTTKLARALGEPLPRIGPAIHRFWELYQAGYPQRLRLLQAN
jgi:dTDP-4-dehydrorhamnose reductase